MTSKIDTMLCHFKTRLSVKFKWPSYIDMGEEKIGKEKKAGMDGEGKDNVGMEGY